MAEVTVNMTKSTAGYVDPKLGVYGTDEDTTSQTIINELLGDIDNHIPNRSGYQLSIFHLSSVANTNTWTSGLQGVIACAWQADDPTDDDVRVAITSYTKANDRARGSAVFTFVAGGTRNGWLWVLHGT